MACRLKYWFLLGFSIYIFFDAKAQKSVFSEKDLKDLYGLAGKWKMEKQGSSLFEEWWIAEKGQLSGKSYKNTKGQITPLESVRLYLSGGKIVYAPTMTGQNDEKEVLFYLERIQDGAYVFENKQHDFPHTISYQMVGSDSLAAYIEGIIGNQTKRINYNYNRIK